LHSIHNREVAGLGEAHHVRLPAPVHGDAMTFVIRRAAQVGAVDQGVGAEIDVRREGVPASCQGGTPRAGRGEITRFGEASQIDLLPISQVDTQSALFVAAAQVGAVDQRTHSRQAGVEDCKEDVLAACPRALKGVQGGEVGRLGAARQVGQAGAIHLYCIGDIQAIAAQVGGIQQRSAAAQARVDLDQKATVVVGQGGLVGVLHREWDLVECVDELANSTLSIFTRQRSPYLPLKPPFFH
jgi:hypothetical protein